VFVTYNVLLIKDVMVGAILTKEEGWQDTTASMAIKVQSQGDQFETNMDARLVEYVIASQRVMCNGNFWHMATDKAFASGLHMQNSIITQPTGVAALYCPQACHVVQTGFFSPVHFVSDLGPEKSIHDGIALSGSRATPRLWRSIV
jgi:hypothetical protein